MYCAVCGEPASPGVNPEARLTPPVASSEQSARVRSRLRPRRLVVGAAVVAGLCVVVGLAFLGVEEYRTHAELGDTSLKLQHTTRSLGHAETTLASTDKVLQRTAATLSAAQAQVKSSQSEIQQLHQQINGQQNTIAGSRQEIADLNTCLNGVVAALNFINTGDNTDAVAALNSINAVCNRASANLPQ
jgi:peptidoglycan hydrolase CwlO-like protein